MTGPSGRRDDLVPVTCWCEKKIVLVDRILILTGQTKTCGRPGCHPPIKIVST